MDICRDWYELNKSNGYYYNDISRFKLSNDFKLNGSE